MQEIIFEEFILYKVQNNMLSVLTLPFSTSVTKRIENTARFFYRDAGRYMGYIDGVRMQDIYNIAEFMHDEKINNYTALSRIPTKDQIFKLIALLKVNTSVRTIDLRNCNVDDDIALFFIDMLKYNKTIRRIDLSNNDKIAKEIAKQLIATVKANKQIADFRIHSYRTQQKEFA